MVGKSNLKISDSETPGGEGATGDNEVSALGVLADIGLGSVDAMVEHIGLLEAVVDNFPGGISLFDKNLQMVLCNEQQKRLLDYPDELFADGLPSLEQLFRFNAERGEYGPGDVEQQVSERMTKVKRMEAHQYERERPNGTIVEVRGVPLEGGGFVTTYLDVTEQRQRVRQLEALLDNFPGGISLFDKHLNMVLCNDRQKNLLDYPDELFSDGLPSLEQLFRFNAERGEYGPGNVDTLVKERLVLAAERQSHAYDRVRPNGKVLEVRGVPLEDSGFVTTYLDVTDQRQNQALIAHMAHHDMLTELPNRLLFHDRLDQALARARRGHKMALLYLDLDKFKPVNDTYGHAAGDALLKAVADRLRHAVRETDTVARLGGDEFAIIQVGVNEVSDIEHLARRVVDEMRTPFPIEGNDIEIGTSIGIAMAPDNGTDADELIRKADAAVYVSKTSGRGTFKFC